MSEPSKFNGEQRGVATGNQNPHAFYGKYRGVVSDNQDPLKRGRIRIKAPDVLSDRESGWALPCVPYAGKGSGLLLIPPVNAFVWIEFEQGDLDYPIWSGCFWGDIPSDEGGSQATPDVKILRGQSGLLVALHDDTNTVVISDKDGRNMLKVEVEPGMITVKADTKVVVDSPQIELVSGASHPLVFGDSLLQYLSQLVTLFNTHMHPGEMAIGVLPVTPMVPVPTMTPPTPDLLSVQVKTG